MPAATPYLFFNGTCREAMTEYARIFGTEPPEIMGFSDMPPEARAGMGEVPADAVMHAALRLGQTQIYASDDPSPEGSQPMAGCNVHVSFASVDQAQAVFDELAKGGEVRMPFKEEFWTPGFGALSDRWGVRWMVSVDAPQGG